MSGGGGGGFICGESVIGLSLAVEIEISFSHMAISFVKVFKLR